MRVWLAAGLVSILLAGCAGDAGTQSSDDEDIDFGDVEATETTGIIRGLVVDEAIRPLVGAVVSIAQPNRTATSGLDGQFAFAGLDPGTYFLTVALANYSTTQSQAVVVAGDDEPPITKVFLQRLATTDPYVDAINYAGYLTFGAAVGATSVGTTVFGPLADAINDRSIWYVQFTTLPMWAQGELVWDQTQAAGGQQIWEMTDTSNRHYGYRETGSSPALAYWNTTVLNEPDRVNSTLDPERGIAYRMFGGPHPSLKPGDTCPSLPVVGNPCYFGFGLTVQQKFEVYIHNFYNFVPAEGWRFTSDGPPVVPS